MAPELHEQQFLPFAHLFIACDSHGIDRREKEVQSRPSFPTVWTAPEFVQGNTLQRSEG
jgi:hypothetical protein